MKFWRRMGGWIGLSMIQLFIYEIVKNKYSPKICIFKDMRGLNHYNIHLASIKTHECDLLLLQHQVCSSVHTRPLTY